MAATALLGAHGNTDHRRGIDPILIAHYRWTESKNSIRGLRDRRSHICWPLHVVKF
jgi:hypothetical protein